MNAIDASAWPPEWAGDLIPAGADIDEASRYLALEAGRWPELPRDNRRAFTLVVLASLDSRGGGATRLDLSTLGARLARLGVSDDDRGAALHLAERRLALPALADFVGRPGDSAKLWRAASAPGRIHVVYQRSMKAESARRAPCGVAASDSRHAKPLKARSSGWRMAGVPRAPRLPAAIAWAASSTAAPAGSAGFMRWLSVRRNVDAGTAATRSRNTLPTSTAGS